MKYATGKPKWSFPEDTIGGVLTGMTRRKVIDRVNASLDKSGRPWSELVNKSWSELLSLPESEKIADEVLEEFQQVEGRKFYAGAEISVLDKPQMYILRSEGDVYYDASEFPEGVIGDGDNVFRADDVTGNVMVIRKVGDVNRLIDEGVPPKTIAVIDDSGGTLTAPLLPDFEAVICLAGTVRSHLGILGREFGVPTLMAARLSRPLVNGERVTVQYSAAPQNAEAFLEEDRKSRAVIRPAEDGAAQ
jgi:phosphohistidine swiveling domain-containing protein